MNKRKLGNEKEAYAKDYLICLGYEILTMNYYTKFGEIDIIALHQGMLVFVEVKYRSSEHQGQPWEAINYYKQQAMTKTALCYMSALGRGYQEKPIHFQGQRFDVVTILGDKIKVYPNAFEMSSKYD